MCMYLGTLLQMQNQNMYYDLVFQFIDLGMNVMMFAKDTNTH